MGVMWHGVGAVSRKSLRQIRIIFLDVLALVCQISGMEKLRAYIKDRNLSQNSFALQVGMIPQTLSLILSKQRKLSAEEAIRIEDVTGGVITVRDLV